jgi:nucleoside-diphosphate-sugar epimerase
MKKRLLVCGSTGFIGRNVAEFFADQGRFEVMGTYLNSPPPDHPDIQAIQADLTDRNDVARALAGVDVVIQAAACTSGARDIVQRPALHVTDNAVMNALIFRQAFETGVQHVVFLSCTTMYPSSDRPLKETDFDANAPIYPGYFGGAWTKVYNEKMCEFYSCLGAGRWTVIRHSNVYGPYDKYDLDRSHVFGATLTKVETAQEDGVITVWGPGTAGRDLIYVSDLVDFVDAVLDRQKGAFEVFNVGCGRRVQVKDLVRRIVELSGRRVQIEHDLSKPTVETRLCLDCTKARSLIGWEPKVSLDEGIRRTLEWYRQRKEQVLGVKC